MKSLTTFALVMVAHMLLLTALHAQDPQRQNPNRNSLQTNQADATSAAIVPCSSPNGARFNREPRAHALPQGSGVVDFLPNRLGAGDDLIVEVGSDSRPRLASGDGYYVHRSSTADCSVQFEGGLPDFTFQGNDVQGFGNTTVAADPARDAFFAADARLGQTGGVGLFRASVSTLLDPTACPIGTHSAAQSTSCWTVTPPVLVFPVPGAFAGDVFSIAVDERPTNAGTGAGNVYAVTEIADNTVNSVSLVACTNTLNCGPPVVISAGEDFQSSSYLRVRPDGVITVNYVGSTASGLDIKFVTCTPAGAPNPPVCKAPTVVQKLTGAAPNPLDSNLQPFLFPKHAIRAEAGGKFTTFLVYDNCKSSFGNPIECLNAEVLLTTSTDNGRTWSTPVSVDTATGNHLASNIATDPVTGITQIVYYSSGGDPFQHEVQVFRNQINPGSSAPGTPQMVTQTLDPLDGTETTLIPNISFLGAAARGTSAAVASRLYVSFTSSTVAGTYEGFSAPDLNNSITQVSF
jgi:hypothetical protein